MGDEKWACHPGQVRTYQCHLHTPPAKKLDHRKPTTIRSHIIYIQRETTLQSLESLVGHMAGEGSHGFRVQENQASRTNKSTVCRVVSVGLGSSQPRSLALEELPPVPPGASFHASGAPSDTPALLLGGLSTHPLCSPD